MFQGPAESRVEIWFFGRAVWKLFPFFASEWMGSFNTSNFIALAAAEFAEESGVTH